MQDNNFREVEGLPPYPLPKTNPVRQNIQIVDQVTKIVVEAEKEAERIMQIVYPTTGANATEMVTAPTNRVGHVKQQRAPSAAFNMCSEEENRATSVDGTTNPFVDLIVVINRHTL